MTNYTASSCFVYVVHQVNPSAYKIGISNDVVQRRSALATSNPDPLRIIRTYELPSREIARGVESRLHQRFAHKRIRLEWFQLEPRDIDEIDFSMQLLGYGLRVADAPASAPSRPVETSTTGERYTTEARVFGRLLSAVKDDPQWYKLRDDQSLEVKFLRYIQGLQWDAYGMCFGEGDEK